jgi:cysteinyl-tRNA synthetase
MSKSKGEFLTVSLLEEKGYEPLVYRFFCLQSHYRKGLVFTWENLDNARAAYNKLTSRLAQLIKDAGNDAADKEKVTALTAGFRAAMDDDLNTADGIAAIFELVSEINLDVKDGASKSFAEEALKRIRELTDVLGIFGGEDEEEGLGDDIQALIDERQAARKEKNWARADEIRDQLAAMGITLKDTPQGVQIIRN